MDAKPAPRYLLQQWDGTFWVVIGEFPARHLDLTCGLALEKSQRGEAVRVVEIPSNRVLSEEDIRAAARSG